MRRMDWRYNLTGFGREVQCKKSMNEDRMHLIWCEVMQGIRKCKNSGSFVCRCLFINGINRFCRQRYFHPFSEPFALTRIDREKDVLELCPRYFDVFLQVL